MEEIRLTKENIKKAKSQDLLMVMFAADGAQGEAGAICFYTKESEVPKCYEGNYVYGDIDLKMVCKTLYCIGISPLVKDREAIFLADLEQVQIVDPAEVKRGCKFFCVYGSNKATLT